MNGPRVGILIASLQAGGAERAALGLLDGLLASGIDAFLLTLDRNREMVPVADKPRRELLSRRILHLSGSNVGWTTAVKTLVGPWQWLSFERAARRLGLDVVISIVERANIMNLLGLGGRRRLISIRSYPSLLLASKTPLKRFLVVQLYRALLRRADRVVFVSREAATDFERLFPSVNGRGTVIYNACNTGRVRMLARAPIPREFAQVFDRPVVIACGRMRVEKGHWSLLRAFAEVARSDPKPRLVLLGKGPLLPELARLRDELGLRDRIVLSGFQENPLAWIARSKVFVLPSLWEGFPNSLLEALALGIPVVATDCHSGPRELLAPGSPPHIKASGIETTSLGILVPPPDGVRRRAGEALTREERLLASAIDTALRDDDFRRAQPELARRRIAAFVPDRIVPQWLELIRGLAD